MKTYTAFGMKINNTAIPDPSTFEYTVSDLDLSGERDSNGLLHRQYVATKHNCKIKYDALDYSTVTTILALLNNESCTFEFIRPDTGATYSGDYYVGDRTMNTLNATETDKTKWICDLSFDVIEY